MLHPVFSTTLKHPLSRILLRPSFVLTTSHSSPSLSLTHTHTYTLAAIVIIFLRASIRTVSDFLFSCKSEGKKQRTAGCCTRSKAAANCIHPPHHIISPHRIHFPHVHTRESAESTEPTSSCHSSDLAVGQPPSTDDARSFLSLTFSRFHSSLRASIHRPHKATKPLRRQQSRPKGETHKILIHPGRRPYACTWADETSSTFSPTAFVPILPHRQ